MKKKILVTSIIFNLLIILAGSFFLYKKGGVSYIQKTFNKVVYSEKTYSDYYETKNSIFREISVNANKNPIVFFGDSITDFVEWSDFIDVKVYNRGINGDTTDGAINRLDSIVKMKPSKLFILLGVNDIQGGVNSFQTLDNFNKIIKSFSGTGTKIYIQSILPVNMNKYERHVLNLYKGINIPTVETVEKLNNKLNGLTSSYDNVTFISLNGLLGENEQIKSEYTYDGIHLSGKGVSKWVSILKSHIENK